MAKCARILVVEDEMIVSADIEMQLSDLGYSEVAVAASGKIALSKVLEFRPNLVLMDINLDGRMDGIETATVLKQRFKVPVIYLTAYADQATLDRAKTTHPYGYIVKPFSQGDLQASIEMALYRLEIEREQDESQELSAVQSVVKVLEQRRNDLDDALDVLKRLESGTRLPQAKKRGRPKGSKNRPVVIQPRQA
jgi:CheY-like chemotaxis protein